MSKSANYLKISNHLAGKLDIRDALCSVKDVIERLIKVDHLDVCLIDEDRLWNTTFEVGLRTRWGSSRSLISASPVKEILMGNLDAMITGDATTDARYIFPGAMSEPITRHSLRSRVNVAMKLHGRTIGSLNCSSKEEDVYDEDTIEEVRNIADVLSPYFLALRSNERAKNEAIARTETLMREEGLIRGALSLTEALEQERQRIGMDLHDQTLADLTRIARDFQTIKSIDKIGEIHDRLQVCIQGLREIIDTSIPSILELFGFQHAIRTHLQQALKTSSGVETEVTDETQDQIDHLPAAIRTALYRIVQEAINNAVMHAQASAIRIVISRSDKGELIIQVQDNGQFSINDPSRVGSGGLEHMQTRARLIGALFTLDETDGTLIGVVLPPRAVDPERGSA
ncbi:ATP-binding protein [Falsihalocynthiibacter sp. S25ZX9]|uniref:GAF domain-containing sensor histidine kinase n=1 Tax=Falsihalocynthiibacter sp. S25ZX9 TaxID=3240870 RepID=UPI003510C52D